MPKDLQLPGLIFLLLLFMGQAPLDVSLEGRLTNLVTGGPVRKATILLVRQGPDRLAKSAVSDANGHFVFRGLTPGRYGISAMRDGFLPFTYGAKGPNRPGKLITLAAGQKVTDLNFTMEPPAVISGRVLDEDSEPVAGITIEALHENYVQGDQQFSAVRSAVTNDIGEYRLFGLPPGRFYILSLQSRPQSGDTANSAVYSSVFYPSASDFGGAAPLRVGAGGEARDIDINVRKTSAAALRGTVTNFPPGAERTLQVQMWRKDRANVDVGSRAIRAFNSGSGQFDFQGLTPGSYTVSAWIQDTEKILYAHEDVEIGAADANDVRLTLARGVDVPGVVLFDGEPAPDTRGLRVFLSRTGFLGPAPASAINPDHSFVLKGVTPGTEWNVGIMPVPLGSYIESIKLGDRDGLTRPISVSPTAKVALTYSIGLHGGSVQGLARTAGEHAITVDGATVLLAPTGDYKHVASYFRVAISDNEGRYEMKGIAPGTYRLFALEEMEPLAYLRSDFMNRLNGKGKEIQVVKAGRTVEDVTVEP